MVFFLRQRKWEFPQETPNDVIERLLKPLTRGHHRDTHMIVIVKGFHMHQVTKTYHHWHHLHVIAAPPTCTLTRHICDSKGTMSTCVNDTFTFLDNKYTPYLLGATAEFMCAEITFVLTFALVNAPTRGRVRLYKEQRGSACAASFCA